MLRVYVSHALRLSPRRRALKEARKIRHLEQEQDCSCDFNEYNCSRHCTPYSWWVFPTVYGRMFCERSDITDITGILRVKVQFQLFCISQAHLTHRRSALRGRPWQTPALWPTWRAIYFLFSLYSLPTSCYFSSCSLSCFACVSEELVP
jgi:hypothetical protein